MTKKWTERWAEKFEPKNRAPRRWQEEKLYFDGDSFFDDLKKAIDEAQSCIDLETYIFSPDDLGREIETSLINAARRGIRVRLLVDGIGAANWIPRRNADLEATGVSIRVYHPVYFSTVTRRLVEKIGLIKPKPKTTTRGISRLNRRDHRKICVVDKEVAFVGSLNISGDHSKRHSAANAWRDTAIRVRGKAIRELIRGFNFAWVRSHIVEGKRQWRETLLSHRVPRLRLSPLVRLNHTLRLRRAGFQDFRTRLHNANQRLWITNAYLAPSHPMMKELKAAARRGLDVRILVPRDSDVFFMPWVARSHYPPLLKAGVRIFEYLPSFLHAKSVIIDNWAAIGTSNLNRRSLLRDFEVDLVVTHEESIRELERQYLEDLKHADEIKVPGSPVQAWLGRVFGFVLKNWL